MDMHALQNPASTIERITIRPEPLRGVNTAAGAAGKASAGEPASAFSQQLEQSRATPYTSYPRMVKSGGSASDRMAPASAHAPQATEYSFWDALDVINPLQHIPGVSTLYRELTGDTIKPEMKLAGSTALGGVFGFFAGLADAVITQQTGRDMGQTVLAAITGNAATPATTQVAQVEANQESLSRLEEANRQLAAMPNLAQMEAAREQAILHPTSVATASNPDSAVLSLFGGSKPSAATAAYQQAQFKPYLRQVDQAS
jgi:hypothetical protein